MGAAATRSAILLESLRFMDVGAEDISWAQVFVVYSLVQGLTAIPISAGDAGISDIANGKETAFVAEELHDIVVIVNKGEAIR